MLAFLEANLSSIIVGAVVVVILFFVVRHLVKNKRSLTCSCGNCDACGSSGVCSIHEQEKKRRGSCSKHPHQKEKIKLLPERKFRSGIFFAMTGSFAI